MQSTVSIVFLYYFYFNLIKENTVGGKVKYRVDTMSFAAHHNAKCPEGHFFRLIHDLAD